jgi:hypothetical protein
MYSYQQFTPGNKSLSGKIITYVAQGKDGCVCVPEKYEKFIRQPNATNISNYQRVSNILKTKYSGNTQFGNVERPVVVNYLGRTAGQPGGSGAPPKNRF